MSKRSRDDNEISPPEWWTVAINWIQSSGGTIDSSLILTENRDVLTTLPVKKGQVLMDIPSSCLVSKDNILLTETGKLLESAFKDESVAFSNQRRDLLIAMGLANRGARFQQYRDTLPASSDFDMLPRRWNDTDLQELLTGSCLLERVTKSRQETREDYDTIRSTLPDMKAFPSFSEFDDMLAAVSSRAFAGMGGPREEDVAMVPLLDLCNHRRGNVTKSVSYFKTDRGSVRVVAAQDLDARVVLAITYGARGNAQLLFNYGFCIPDNIEPDGSSNDVLEFKAKDDVPPIELRSGPKSYTFGGFTKVLEMFHETPERQEEVGDVNLDKGGMDDIEAFLNQCDQEEGGLGWDGAGENDDMEDDELSEEAAVKAELLALAGLLDAIRTAKERYSMRDEKLVESLAARDSTPRYYAAILVASELRTLYLYELGVKFVRAKLSKEEPSGGITCAIHLSKEDETRLRAQAEQLAQAFIKIRYPFIS